MIRKNIADLLDGLVQRKERRPRSSFTGLARRAWRSQQAECLEDRSLLTLIGIDFGGGGSTPANWTGYAGTSNTTLNGLVDESGTATSVNVGIAFDNTLQGGTFSFQPPASELPIHTQSLAGVNGAYADSGNVELSFSGLAANTPYEIYVFAGDLNASLGSNRVTVTSGNNMLTFNQPHDRNQLVINSEVGDSSRDLSSYAKLITTDAGGTMLVRVDNAPRPTEFFGLAGIALQASTPGIVSISDVTVDEGAGTATVDVSISAPEATDVTLALATSDVTAIADEDYTAASVSAQVTIPAGDTSATFTVAVTDDQTVESAETFQVSVTSVVAGNVTDSSDTGTVTITDNDSLLTLGFGSVSISESAGAGATTGTVTRNGDTTNALVVTLASDDSSEVQVASSVTIPAGQTSATFDLDAIDDILLDGPKTVTITASATNFTSGTLTITVTDDDVASLTLTADSTTVSETAGTAATMLTLSRNTPTTTDLVVDLASSDTSELDVAQTVVIPAGQVSVRNGTAADFVSGERSTKARG